jgi:DNA-binding CsgD family transcriptional regulator
LGHRDYEVALSLVSEAAATQGVQPFEPPTVEALLRASPADCAGYFEYSNGGVAYGSPNTFFVDEPALSCPVDWCSDAVRDTICTWPLEDVPCTGPRAEPPPLKLSDFLTGAQRRRNPWYNAVMRPSGIEHEPKVWLPSAEGIIRGFFFVRGPRQRDFDERDRALLALVRPHLARIRARWERRRRPPLLTRREAEVLELVELGLTNGEIASRLVISRTTVRTHLENVFEKLGVHTRTAAVSRARDLATHV